MKAVKEAGLVLAVAVAMALAISVAEEPGAMRSPDALAYLLGVVLALLLLWRRRHPLAVLVASIGVMFVYYAFSYPAFSPAVPLAAATYAAAAAGHALRAGAILGVTLGAVGLAARLHEGESVAHVIRLGLLTDVALLVAVLLLGEAVRSRRAWAQEVRRRLARADQDREREAERRVQQERVRIARDMHDVLAHTIAGITVQAGVAADVLDESPARARAALEAIRRQSRAAMGELTATVGVLRDGGAETPRAPAPGLADVEGLVAMAAGAGVRVAVAQVGLPQPLPAAVDLSAYRILQESLTNVVRHAGASTATVTIRYDHGAVVLEVVDDGRGAANGAPPSAAGHGLAGMRERAAAVGGRLEAGAGPDGGFRVHATLPLERPGR